MSIDQRFTQFLTSIRPDGDQKTACKYEHTLLRERLAADPRLKGIVVTTLLQGSYRRSTLVQSEPGKKPDVDVVVVTTLSGNTPPATALQTFHGFLYTYYPNRWKLQGRSLGIVGSRVELDLVVTAAPSLAVQNRIRLDADRLDVDDQRVPRVTDWEREEPLWIPDREQGRWERTHPLAQIAWTQDKNRRTNGHYVNVVKVIKWWKRVQPSLPKYPKSYPLEHMVGDCCPDGITSMAEGVTRTFEAMVSAYSTWAQAGQVPALANRGLVGTNVLARVPAGDFRAFVQAVIGAARTARAAYDHRESPVAVQYWRQLFGPWFPA
ncbi:MAG: nucleotidyltransferase [Myxococcales bacterium]|nr:nucleotidyltransferase [Myxococcales bacterium]